MDLIKIVEQQYAKSDIPEFRPGDTVRVDYKVVEGGKERIQAFQENQAKAAASERLSQSARFPTALAWKELSHYTAPKWLTLKSCAGVRYAVPNCTT